MPSPRLSVGSRHRPASVEELRLARDRLRPILLKNSTDPRQDPFSGFTQPLPRLRSSILDRSERSVFTTLRARPRRPSFSTEKTQSCQTLVREAVVHHEQGLLGSATQSRMSSALLRRLCSEVRRPTTAHQLGVSSPLSLIALTAGGVERNATNRFAASTLFAFDDTAADTTLTF